MLEGSDIGKDDFTDASGQSSDNEQDTEGVWTAFDATDSVVTSMQANMTVTDPSSGTVVRVAITASGKDKTTDGEFDSTGEVNTSGPSGSSTQSTGGDDDLQEQESLSGQVQLVVTTQGKDAQGEQLTGQETIILGSTGASNTTDDDTTRPDGSSTDALVAMASGTAQLSDTLKVTTTAVDPATGITTTTTDTLNVTGNGGDQEQENATDTISANGTETDTANQTDSGSATDNWTSGETVTTTNPNGSSTGAPTSTSNSGNDTRTWSAALVLSSSAQIGQTVNAADSGTNTSSDPTAGTTSWSNQPLDSATISRTFPQQFGAQGIGGSSGSGSGGATPSSGISPGPSPPWYETLVTTLFGYDYYKRISHKDNPHVRLNELVIAPAYDSASSAAQLAASNIVDPVGTMIQQGKQTLHAVVNYEQTLDSLEQSIHTLATNDDAKIKFISAQIPFMLLPAAPVARTAGLVEGRLVAVEARFAMGFRGQALVPIAAEAISEVDAALLAELASGLDVPIRAGTTGIRTLMSDLTLVSGNEVALIRLRDGSRVLRMGGPNNVRMGPQVRKLIAHTHPRGSLRFSQQDIKFLRSRLQQHSVIIDPNANIGVLLPVPSP